MEYITILLEASNNVGSPEVIGAGSATGFLGLLYWFFKSLLTRIDGFREDIGNLYAVSNKTLTKLAEIEKEQINANTNVKEVTNTMQTVNSTLQDLNTTLRAQQTLESKP